MSQKRNALYDLDQYYLLPDGCPDCAAFIASLDPLPAKIQLRSLPTDFKVPGENVKKGVCIAPYFYSDYGFPEETVQIDDVSDLFPVEVELLTQAEYNQRLREMILEHCPGCIWYKPISKHVQSLNRFFYECALNGVCFCRQTVKPSPRVFRVNLHFYGGAAQHFPPENRRVDELLDDLKCRLYLKWTGGTFDSDAVALTVSYAPDFFTQTLTQATAEYVEKHLYFTKLKILSDPTCVRPYGVRDIQTVLSPENRDALRKNCKRCGVALAKLCFNPAYAGKVERSLETLFLHDYARVLCADGEGQRYLMLLDGSEFLKELHFRSPLLEAAGTTVEVYGQEDAARYTVSFEMKKEPIE